MKIFDEAIRKLCDELEVYAPQSPNLAFARGVMAGVGIRSKPNAPGAGRPPRKPNERDTAMAAAYEGGASLCAVAAQFETSPGTVRNAITRVGIAMRRAGCSQGVSADLRSEVFWAEYQSGKTLEQIGREQGMTRERVRQIIVKGGYNTKDVVREQPQSYLNGIAAYLAGDNLHTAAHIAGVASDTFKGILTRNGHKTRARAVKYDQEKATKIVAMYSSGVSTKEIGSRFSMPQSEVYRWLGRAGVRPNRQHRGPSLNGRA